MKRTLSLKRESLADLTTTELADIAGANGVTGPQPTPPQPVLTYTCTRTIVCPPTYLTQDSSCDYC